MIFPDLFDVSLMFLRVTGVLMSIVSSLSLSTIVSSMKFSIALLSSRAFL